MTRQLAKPYLEEFCEYAMDTEVPPLFALWAGISSISMALGRSSWIEFGHSRLFANLYIVLVAGSATCRKSTAIGLAEGIVKNLTPSLNLLSQKGSPEGLIHLLRGCPPEEQNNKIIERCEGHYIVDELSTLIDSKAFQSGMIPVLTTLWDSKDYFEYATRSRGKECLRNVYLTILGGSTADWIREAIPEAAIGGGFTSRVVFVYQENPGRDVPFPIISEENKRRKIGLCSDLNEISALKGRFTLSPNAQKLYAEEYSKFKKDSPFVHDRNLSGYAGRRHVMLLKLGMIFSASESSKMLIEADDIRRGIATLEAVERSLPKVMQAITSDTVGDICEDVLKFIKNEKAVKRSALVSRYRHKLPVKELQTIIDTLIEMAVIIADNTASEIIYVYKGRI